MRFTIWEKPSNTIDFGIFQNFIYAVVIFFVLNLISFKIYDEGKAVALLFFMIPVSASISGIINGFILMKKGLNKASKTNFIIGGIGFIIGSTCSFMLFLL